MRCKRLRQASETAGSGVKNLKQMLPCHPYLVPVRHKGVRSCALESDRIGNDATAGVVPFDKGLRHNPEVAVAIGVRFHPEYILRIHLGYFHHGRIGLLVISHQRGVVIVEIKLAVRGFHNVLHIAASGRHLHPLEIIALGIAAHAVDSGNPQTPSRIAEYISYLVVEKRRAVTTREILVELVGVVFVEATESAEPDMPLRVLAYRVDELIRQLRRNRRGRFSIAARIALSGCGTPRKHKAQYGCKFVQWLHKVCSFKNKFKHCRSLAKPLITFDATHLNK